jgi:hypothetical protein
MTRIGAIVRLLMLLACAVPFTSARQAWATMNPRTANTAPAPFVPIQEEEDTEREEAAGGKEKVRTSPPPHHPRAVRTQTLHAGHAPRLLTVIPTSPAPLDPFRNGLGCPFRC